MRKPLTFVTLLLAATACSKDKTEPSIDFGPNGGFTPRYSNAMSAGPEDPTDWTSDASWNEKEQKLFASLQLPMTGSQVGVNDWGTDFFSNPCAASADGRLHMGYMRNMLIVPTNERASFVIVDAHYKVLDTFDYSLYNSPYSRGVAFQLHFDPTKYLSNKLYRVYYVMYIPGQQVYYRGHGDIKIR